MADWELIVVDDGSTDGTADWVAGIDDGRIRLLAMDHCGFPSKLRNCWIAAARAEWIAFADSDDLWASDKLERQLDLHRARPQLRWSCTGFEMIDALGAPVSATRFRPWAQADGLVRALLLNQATLALPSVMMARSLLRELHGFDEHFQFVEDYELWFRACRRADCGIVYFPLLKVVATLVVRHAVSQRELDVVLVADLREIYRDSRVRRREEALSSPGSLPCGLAGSRACRSSRVGESRRAFGRALRLRPVYPWAWKCLVQAAYRRLL